MLNEAQTKKLTEYLTENQAVIEMLSDQRFADAQKAMQSDGMEITAEELQQFVETMMTAAKKDSGSAELDADALDAVYGGASSAMYSVFRWYLHRFYGGGHAF